MRFKIQEIQDTLKTDYDYNTNLEWCKVGVLIDTKTGNKWDVNELTRRANFLTINKLVWYIYSCMTSENCTNCVQCYDCINCTDCTNCRKCVRCRHCEDCNSCNYSEYCNGCTDAMFSNFSYNCKFAA